MSDTNDLKNRIKNLISQNKIMVFSKTYCPYSKMAKSVFEDLKVEFKVHEVDEDEKGPEIQNILEEITGGRSVPRVFIKGKFIGGGSDVKKLHEEGKLSSLIED